ncbi:MAG: xanthine dehydrogenase family protein molybdopterin-binding subunit [Thaumarchaeota archaeon]|jgi:carbon-monoxide dehydrogenase large subunit|nr:xanthine dehydrogenase family protein molybdopterin-binding subunit [Candidatus Geocrenenecus arthurdayi]
MTVTIEKQKYKIIDEVVPRIDALEKATGYAVYTSDIDLPNMLYGKILRSPYPHARIKRIDTEKAESLLGVKAVVTGREFPYLFGETLRDKPALAVDKVRYVGEPVAAVAAVDERIAEEALSLIEVEYELLPYVLDPIEAMSRDAPILHEGLAEYKRRPIIKVFPGTNICNYVVYEKGDIEKGFAESDHIFEDTFKTPGIAHAAIEPYVTIAQVDFNGKITLWTTNDSPYRLQVQLAESLNIDPSNIRVIVPYMGGSFGGKGGVKLEAIAIALARKVVGYPVKIELNIEEIFTSTCTSHSAIVTVKTGVKKDGTIVARYVKAIYDAGAYAEKGPTVLIQGCRGAAGPYRIPHVKIEGYLCYTNKIPGDAYRGYGFFQAQFAVESQMDDIARELGLDPLEFRLKNLIREGDVNPLGQEVVSCGLDKCLLKVAESIGWGRKEGRYVGKGIAVGFKNTKTPSSSAVTVRLNWDGSLEVYTSLVEEGQGSKHVLAKIAANELGIPLSKVKVITSDTEVTPWDTSTTSSRTVFHQGNALIDACRKVIEQIKDRLAEKLNVKRSEIIFEDGEFIIGRDRISLHGNINRILRPGEQIVGYGLYEPKIPAELWEHHGIFWMYVAHGVEVEVDPETGIVTVKKAVIAEDVGKAMDKTTLELQLIGGTIQGIGNTLYEELKFDRCGRIENPNFRDYHIPTTLDVGEVIPIIVEQPHPEGPYGAKGVGEGPLVTIHAAIANAIYDAIGIRFKELPITPEKIALMIKNVKKLK